MSGDEPELRASDAEREQTVQRLRVAAGEGRLTLEELSDRIEAASGSRTRGELATLTRDLPAPGDGGGGAVAAAGVGAAGLGASLGGPAGAAHVVLPADPGVSSVFGDHKRAGRWRLPERSSWKTVFGDITLDLREAQVPAGEIVIEASTVFGDVELLVPEGVIVDLRIRTFLGDTSQKAGLDAPPGAPRIIVTGRTTLGDVRVRARRLSERLAGALLAR